MKQFFSLFILSIAVFFSTVVKTSTASASLSSACEFTFTGDLKGKSVYYAHPLSLYDRPLEARDVKKLKKLGLDVRNPNDEAVEAAYQVTKDFNVFLKLAETSDMVAVRAFPDGKISSGVVSEALKALEAGKPVFELRGTSKRGQRVYSLSKEEIEGRALTREQTVVYLDRIGVVEKIKYK